MKRHIGLDVPPAEPAPDSQFSVAHLSSGPVAVLGESRRATITAGELRDRFEPYAVHTYELPAR